MIKNYFLVAIRNIWKNKVFTIINIGGLAIGLACSFLIFLHVFTELSYDDHFADADDIYRLAVKSSMSDNAFEAAVTGGPLAQILEQELPEVNNYTRLREGRMTLLGASDKTFYEEKILFADSSFFELFSFKVLEGNPAEMLIHPYSMVLTEKMADKFFGDENPVGKEIKWNNDRNYIVSGVVEDFTQKTHLDFDILVSFSTLYQNDRYRNFIQNLFAYSTLNYIKVHPGTNAAELEEKIAGIVDKHMGERLAEYGGTYDVFLQPITSIYLHSDILHELRTNSDVSFVYIFTSVAILILIIACINFINLSRKLVAATFGRSMYSYDLHQDTLTTSINKPVASAFAKVNVYPNPFASILNIKINSLQKVESCEVFIVDISGKKIANIYSGNIEIEGQLISWKPNMNIKKGFG